MRGEILMDRRRSDILIKYVFDSKVRKLIYFFFGGKIDIFDL
jgi:hypothetical protein